MNQDYLIPPLAVRRKNVQIPLAEIPEVTGPFSEPSDMLVKSIHDLGILHRPLVTKVVPEGFGTAYWRVLDGRRRIEAARQLEYPFVACVELTFPEHDNSDEVALQMHGSRSNNPVAEAVAIRSLVKEGLSVSTIARSTGLSVATVKSRMVLHNLSGPLWEALTDDLITVNVALACAKLPSASQDQAYQILTTYGKLTHKDVREIRQVRKAQQATQLDLTGIADQVRKNVSPSAYLSNEDLGMVLKLANHCMGIDDGTRNFMEIAQHLEQKIKQLGVSNHGR